MRNIKLIVKIVGQLLLFEALLMLVCCGVSLYYGDDDVFAFVVSILITIIGGVVLSSFGRDAINKLSKRDSYLVITSTWVIFSLFGTLPYIISGYIPSFSDAFFEAMSNFTTTGLSTFNVEMPHGLILWRSLAQWIGGLGIVFFTVAILPSFAEGDVKIFAAESSGLAKRHIHPRIRTNSKWIWVMYFTLTFVCIICLMLAGMNLFESINHAMVTTATGGHSQYGDSIAHFDSPAIEYTEIVFMFLAGVNFAVLYSAMFKLKFKTLFANSEIRLYCMVIAMVTVVLTIALFSKYDFSFEHAFRTSLFQTVSIITSTGFYCEDLSYLPDITWSVLCFCMIMGACSGSTSGGIKSIRVVMSLKNARNEFRRILHPNAVLPIKVNNEVVSKSVHVTLSAFITLYAIILIVSTLVFVGMGIDMDRAFQITVSCISNCGPAFGPEIDAYIGWDVLPVMGKWLCSALMLIGRLEIFAVFILFTRNFWKDE